MKPIVLKGHERSITSVKFNHDGDLLVSASKDDHPTLWRTSNGERLGSFQGHEGVVWCFDIDEKSTMLLTGSGDTTAKLWDFLTGECLYTFKFSTPVRAAGFSVDCKMFAVATDDVMGKAPLIYVFNISDDINKQTDKPFVVITCENKITNLVWGPLNRYIITSHEDGTLCKYSIKNGNQIEILYAHNKTISDIQIDEHRQILITASADMSSKLIDIENSQGKFEIKKTYLSDTPVNSACMDPVKPHIMIGGGQEAMSVTTTSTQSGRFEAKFYHVALQDELGSLGGHFGPINTMNCSRDGKLFVTGAEDGYCRLYHFDESYLKIPKLQELVQSL